jgi:hypothetical protein
MIQFNSAQGIRIYDSGRGVKHFIHSGDSRHFGNDSKARDLHFLQIKGFRTDNIEKKPGTPSLMKDQRLLNKFWKEGNSPVFETF